MKVRASLLLLFALCSAPVSAAPILAVAPSTGTFDVGKTFTVGVTITGVTDLFGFQFDLGFNSAVLGFVSVEEGDFLSGSAPNTNTTFFIPGTIDVATPGLIAFTANTLVGAVPGVSGGGVLATFSFTALEAGISPFTLSNVVLLDSAGLDILAEEPYGSASVEVTAPTTAVPEPTTFLLLGSGLVSLGFRHRRRSPA